MTTEKTYSLHPVLAADSLAVATLSLCDLRLINDRRYLWCVLIPRMADLRDFHDVPVSSQGALLDDINLVSTVVQAQAQADKMNVAALGNMVEQLHIHVVARHRDDPAWPGPIWGVGSAEPYTDDEARVRIERLRAALTQ